MTGDWLSVMMHVVMSSRIIPDNLSVNDVIFQLISEGLLLPEIGHINISPLNSVMYCFVLVSAWLGLK